jgi:hypothetical protein
MLRRYYYLVNPLCAMAAQGMKTVYADPWNTSMWRAFVVPNRLNHDVRVARLFATTDAARVDAIDIVEWTVLASVRWRSPLQLK